MEEIKFKKENIKQRLLNLKRELLEQKLVGKISTNSIDQEFLHRRNTWFQKVVDNLRLVLEEGTVDGPDTYNAIRDFLEYTTSPEFHNSRDHIDDIKRATDLIDKVTV